MKLTEKDWTTLSELLDEALDLPAEARAVWVDGLAEQFANLKPTLHKLFTQTATAETGDFLATLPKLTSPAEEESLPSTAHFQVGAVVGQYRLLRELGQGGMGAVWLAERTDGVLKRTVALKLPLLSIHNKALAHRFARERDILAQLAHPHIARLYDAGVTPTGQPFLALEFVEGVPLTEYCDVQRLPVRSRIDLFLQILAAVQYAHRNLVVHRDLKPSNILVTSEGQARLLDFGIAKLLLEGEARETELTQVGGRALTPDYASPEQILGEPVTTASDVYSLGVVLYELLCGSRPYRLKRDSRAALEEAILAADPVWPSHAAIGEAMAEARLTTAKKLSHALAGELDAIVGKALKKNPLERYTTADAFAQDLDRYLKGEAVTAQPDSGWYRTRKFLWRNKVAAASAAAIFVALAAGLGVALWQARIARTEARTAEAVQTFMGDIFRTNSADQTDPLKAQQTTARELLDVGLKKIDASLRDAPEAKVSVLATLADIYDDLGLTEQAVLLGRQRVALARATYGTGDIKVASALIDLAGPLHESASVNERESMLREAESILDRHGDRASKLRGDLFLRLAEHYQSTDLAKTIDFARRGVAVFRGYPPSFDLVQVLTMEGIAHDARKEYGEAVAVLAEASQVAATLPTGARRTEPIIHAYLAEALFNLDDLAGAERSYRQAWQAARALRGEEHEDTVQTQLRLGSFLVNTGRPEEGLRLLAGAKDLVRRTKGASDIFHTPRVLSNYGSALIQYGQIEAGVAELSTAIELRRQDRSGTRQLAQMLENLAPGEIALGHYADASRLLDEASAIRTKLGDQPASAQFNANALARAELALATAGKEELARVLARLPGEAGPTRPSPTSLGILVERARLALVTSRPQEAIAIGGRARRAIEASPLRPYLKIHEAGAALVEGEGMLADGRPSDALPLLSRAVDLASALYDRGRSPLLADAQIALAECYLDLRQPTDAKPLLAQALAVQATHKELGEHFKKPLRELEARLQRHG